MLHLGNGGDNGLYRWFFDNATTRGVPFDVIGASYYCYWHGSLESLQANLTDMAVRIVAADDHAHEVSFEGMGLPVALVSRW